MPYKCISIDEAKVLLDKGGVTIADVRDAGAYSAGSIEKAVNVQQATIQEFMSSAGKETPLIIYCYHGHSSQGAADYFFDQGYEEVYSIDGGYEAWRLKY
jgi:thiosulfate sulfurtransferase